jgi:hypothetical protein
VDIKPAVQVVEGDTAWCAASFADDSCYLVPVVLRVQRPRERTADSKTGRIEPWYHVVIVRIVRFRRRLDELRFYRVDWET